MLYVYCWLKSWLEAEEGQDLIEYVLIAGFIALAALTGLGILSGALTNGWNSLADSVNEAIGG